jgi:hypothetical protein
MVTVEPLKVVIEPDGEHVTLISAAGHTITLPRLWAANLVMDLEVWLAGHHASSPA